MKKLLSLIVAASVTSTVMADSFTIDGLTYVTTSDNTVELSVADVDAGDIVIPATVLDNGKTFTVTSIGESAFLRKQITSVEMPNTITRVGSKAFQFCMSITKVKLSENLEVIGANAFQTNRALVDINWPKSLKSINAYAFQYVMNYEGQIWLPKGISVEDRAFVNMSKATSLWINGQPSEWGANVCEGCSNLTKLYVNCMYPPTFDPSVTFPIDPWGWDDPTPITLYVPVGAKSNYLADDKWVERFESIEEMEFTDTDMTNPSGEGPGTEDREYETYTDEWSDDDTVARLNVAEAGSLKSLLEDKASGVVELYLSGKLNGDDILCLRNMAGASLDGSVIQGAILEKLDLTNCEIVAGGNKYYSYLQSYSTEQDVIGPKMFSGCYSITEFAMPKYAISLGEHAFDGAAAMAKFTFSPTTESIGELAFYNCVALESLDIPDGCSSFGDMVFYACRNLKQVHLPEKLTALPFGTFYFCEQLEEITVPEGVKRIENLAFHNCASLSSVSIPAATNKIDANAFSLCDALTEINVAEGNADYSDIDGVLFNKNKSKLLIYPVGRTQVRYEIPRGTISVEENAMTRAAFSELIIPEGVVSMKPGAAAFCPNLQLIEMPSTLVTITKAFESCPALENYKVAEGNEQFADLDGVLCNASKTVILKYPVGRKADKYTVPEGVEEIGEEAFLYAAFESVTLSEGVTKIGVNGFAICSNLTKCSLPASLELIQEGAFAHTSLEEITCNAIVPPVCEHFVDDYGVAQPFVGVDVANCKLNVPMESLEAYAAADVWSEFQIIGMSGILDINDNRDNSAIRAYTIDGTPVSPDAKGIVIIRTADGRVIKQYNR